MSQGIRHNQGKPQWSQIDFKALEPMVRVLEQGGERVGRDNWKKGLLVRETIESLLRHTFALLAGEDNDQESNQPHIGHILSNAMFISHMLQNRPDMDNRREKEDSGDDQFNAPEAILKFALSDKRGLDCFPDGYADKKLISELDVVVGGKNLKINPGSSVTEAYNAIKKMFESGIGEPKGGVLNGGLDYKSLSQKFTERLKSVDLGPPKSFIEFTIDPELFKHDIDDELIVSHLGQRFKCVVRSIKGCSDGYITPTLEIIGHAESGQNANIGRSYPKDESPDWDPWADTSISLRERQ